MRIANWAGVSPSRISNAPEPSRGGRRSSISRAALYRDPLGYAVFDYVIRNAEKRIC